MQLGLALLGARVGLDETPELPSRPHGLGFYELPVAWWQLSPFVTLLSWGPFLWYLGLFTWAQVFLPALFPQLLHFMEVLVGPVCVQGDPTPALPSARCAQSGSIPVQCQSSPSPEVRAQAAGYQP